MATGASTADVAVILVDARKGLLAQSRRHAFIAALLGVRDLAVAVNKMDMVGFSRAVYEQIATDFRAPAPKMRGARLTFIPVSALEGDNVVERSARMPWYEGPALLDHLEAIAPEAETAAAPLRFPVQLVIRPQDGFRGFAGRIEAGRVRPGVSSGFPVVALPPQQQAGGAESLVGAARKELQQRGILAGRDQFNAGEGI